MYIENFDPNNIEIDKKYYKNIFINYIGYKTIKKDMKIYIAIPLYLIFGKVNEYFEGIKGNKYLTLVPTNESKEKIKKYEKLLIKIRDLIRSITKNLDDYDEKYFFRWISVLKQMNSKNELREIDIKNCLHYYFDDTINGTKTISAIFY